MPNKSPHDSGEGHTFPKLPHPDSAAEIFQRASFLNVEEVSKRAGLGVSTVWAYVRAGRFPKPAHVGPQARRWLSTEVDAWIGDRIAERDQHQPRAQEMRRRRLGGIEQKSQERGEA